MLAVRHPGLSRADRLPGRLLAAASVWLRRAAHAVDAAERTLGVAAAAAATGQAKQYNELAEDAAAVLDGYSSPEAAKDDRLKAMTAAWEESQAANTAKDGRDWRTRLLAFEQAMADERAAEARRNKQAPPAVRRRRRR